MLTQPPYSDTPLMTPLRYPLVGTGCPYGTPTFCQVTQDDPHQSEQEDGRSVPMGFGSVAAKEARICGLMVPKRLVLGGTVAPFLHASFKCHSFFVSLRGARHPLLGNCSRKQAYVRKE